MATRRARLSKEQRLALVTKLRVGHDLVAACASLGISSAVIEAGGAPLAEEVREACAVGTGRLRSRLLEGALADGNVSDLLRLVEQREASVPTGQQIHRVERVVIDGTCPSCGHRHQSAPGVPDPRPGRQSRAGA